MLTYTKELEQFLLKNNLNNSIGYLTLSGSKAYGTDTPTSDTDIRGFFFSPFTSLIKLFNKDPDVIEDKDSDIVIYSFNKFVELLTACNPNVIEMLGTRNEDCYFVSDTAKYMRDNYDMFLSKRAYHTFNGYAFSQLRRLENALKNGEKKDKFYDSFAMIKNKEKEYNDILQKSSKFSYIQIDKGLIVDGSISNVLIVDMIKIFMDMHNIIKNYEKVGHRNNKKTEDKLHKHMMHLIRLYYMGIDILKYGEINTYRNERKFLLSIRNGMVNTNAIFAMVKDLKEEMEDAYKNSKLPEEADKKHINDWYCNVVKNMI